MWGAGLSAKPRFADSKDEEKRRGNRGCGLHKQLPPLSVYALFRLSDQLGGAMMIVLFVLIGSLNARGARKLQSIIDGIDRAR